MFISSCTSSRSATPLSISPSPSGERLLERYRVQPNSIKDYIYEATDTTTGAPALFLTGAGIDLFIRCCRLETDIEIYPTLWVGDLSRKALEFNKSPIKKAAFFVNSSSRLTGHVSALYMEKNSEGKLTIFVSDSLGKEGNGVTDFQSPIVKSLRPLSESIETIYLMQPKRQQGGSECALFSIADILEIVNTPNFFATLEAEGREKFRNITHPPAALMKLTQSFTLLETACTSNLVLRANPWLGHAEMPFSDFIASGTVEEIDQEGLPKKRNAHALLLLERAFDALISHLQSS